MRDGVSRPASSDAPDAGGVPDAPGVPFSHRYRPLSHPVLMLSIGWSATTDNQPDRIAALEAKVQELGHAGQSGAPPARRRKAGLHAARTPWRDRSRGS